MQQTTPQKQNLFKRFFGWYKSKGLVVKIIIIFVTLITLCCLCTVPVVLFTPSSTTTPTAIASVIDESPSDQPTIIPENTATEKPTKTPTNTPEPTNTPVPSNTPEPTSTPDPNLYKPGTYLVGTDIQPGLYKGYAGSGFLDSCYWERLSNLSGGFDSILANANSNGQFYVEIKTTDFAFSTACEFFYLETMPEPQSEFPTTIEPGMYLVGIDIQPGLYKGQAGEDVLESCYWERLSNATHDMNSIIANDNSTSQYYIQVGPNDFALSTACQLELQK